MQILDCEFPDDVYLDLLNDTWLRPLPEKELQLGITSILSFVAGRINAFKPKTQLSQVNAGQNISTIESKKFFGAVRSPFHAQIVEINSLLVEKPRLLNDSPYDKGWVARLKLDHDLVTLISEDQETHFLPSAKARSKLTERIKELKVHCFKKLPDEELVTVGLECAATLATLDDLLSRKDRGTVVHVVSDDPFAEIEMVRWSDRSGNELVEAKQ